MTDDWDPILEAEMEALTDAIQTGEEAKALRDMLPVVRAALKSAFASGREDGISECQMAHESAALGHPFAKSTEPACAACGDAPAVGSGSRYPAHCDVCGRQQP